MATTPATWNTDAGNWFTAGNWDEPNPNPPPDILHFVPGASNDVSIPDNNNVSSFTIAYNGTDTINTLSGAGAATLAINGGSLTVANGGPNDSMGIDVASGATLNVGASSLVITNGAFTGTVGGNGELVFVFGAFSLNAGVNLDIAKLTLTSTTNGTVSTTTLNTDVAYAHNFTAVDVSGNSPVIDLNGHTLTLSGTSTLDGIFNGPGTVKVTGTAVEPSPEYGSNTMIGGAVLEDASGATITQEHDVGLGNASSTGKVQIDAGAIYDIDESSSLGSTNAANAIVSNAGTLEVTGASTSAGLNAQFTNTGTIAIGSGDTLSLSFGGVNTLGGTIGGAGTLVVGAGSTALNTAQVTVGALRLSGGNGGATLTLGTNISLAGLYSFDGEFDTLALNGHTLVLANASNSLHGNVINGAGTVKVTGTADIGDNISIGGPNGAGTAATIEDANKMTQTGNVGLHGTLLIDAGHTYTITAAGNISPLGSGATVTNNGTFSDNAAGTSDVGGAFSGAGGLAVGSGATLVLYGGAETLSGPISGAGVLAFGGGANATIDTSSVTVGTLTLAGGNGGAEVTLGTNLAYAGSFSFGNSFDTLALNGHTLTLSGASDTLHGNVINGAGTVKVTGTADIGDNISIGGPNGAGTAATIEDANKMTQTGNVGLHGTLLIDAGHTYTITAAGNISPLGSGATVTNNGTFTDNAAGTSDVGGAFSGAGGLAVASGATLVLYGGAETLSGPISGAGALAFGGGANATIDTSSVTVGTLTLAGGNGGAEVTLGTNLAYAGSFSFGNSFDTLALNGHTLTLSGASDTLHGNVINGAGTVKVTGTTDIGDNISIGGPNGAGTAATIEDANKMTQTGNVGLHGTLLIDAGHTYTITTAGNISPLGSGATVTNNGTFTDGAAGTSDVGGAFSGAGGLAVGSGATLVLYGGAETLSGPVSGAGALTFGGGANATIDTANVGVGALTLAGGNGGAEVTLGTNLAYAGAFSLAGEFDTLALNGHTLTLSGTSVSLTSSVITGPGTLKVTGSATIATSIGSGGAVTLEDAKTINQTGSLSLSGTLQIDMGATYTLAAATTISSSGSVVNNGTFVDNSSGGTSTVGGSTFTNNGILDAATGSLVVAGALSGSGTTEIGAGQSVKFEQSVAAGQEVEFLGASAAAIVEDAPQFDGTFADFAVGDSVDFANLAYAASDYITFVGNGSQTGGTVTVDNSSAAPIASFKVAGNYNPSQFLLSDDDGQLAVVGAAGVAHQTSNDFNGDENSDILWRNASTGEVDIWLMNGDTVEAGSGYVSALPTNWRVAATGDFNGDGRDGILWQNSSTGEIDIWNMKGVAVGAGSGYVGALSSAWQVAGVGDFTGDGKSDILWRNASTGETDIWFMNGTTIEPGSGYLTALPTAWQIQGVGNFNGDGGDGILWRNTATGEIDIWNMNGKTVEPGSGYVGALSSAWQVAGTGDFNGDGDADILWRNASTGEVDVWLMKGAQIEAGSGYVADLSSQWQIAGVGDYNGDGKSGILWHNSATGEVDIWNMNGTAIGPGSGRIAQLPTDWHPS